MASTSFGRLRRSVWRRRDVPLRLKIQMYNCLIRPIAIYASETWTLREEDKRKLLIGLRDAMPSGYVGSNEAGPTEESGNKGENRHFRAHCGDHKERRLRWFGHVLRRPQESILGSVYSDDFTAGRPVGRPPKRWKHQIAQDVGQPLRQCEAAARDTEDWRELAGVKCRAKGPYSLRP